MGPEWMVAEGRETTWEVSMNFDMWKLEVDELKAKLLGLKTTTTNQSGETVYPEGTRLAYEETRVTGVRLLKYQGLDDEADRYDKSFYFNGYYYEVEAPAGILSSAINTVKKGLHSKMRYEVHAEYGGSLLGDAKLLANAGNFVAAGAVARIVLEQWVRDCAESAEIEGHDTDRVGNVLDRAGKGKVWSAALTQVIRGHLKAGHEAAHGKDVDHSDILGLIQFCEAKCLG